MKTKTINVTFAATLAVAGFLFTAATASHAYAGCVCHFRLVPNGPNPYIENFLTCSGDYPDSAYWDTGDQHYTPFSCLPEMRDAHETSFGFTDTWDRGFGRSTDVCNPNLPYVRTLNAMTALAQLAQVGSDNNYYAFAGGEIEALYASCDNSSTIRVAEAGGGAIDDHVSLFYRFFYNDRSVGGGLPTVVDRASILVHEAQHINHTSPWARPEEHTSCPQNPDWGPQGCDWQYSNSRNTGDAVAGAYSVQVWMLEQFGHRNTRAPRYLRDYAINLANGLLASKFADPTDYWVRPLPTQGCAAGQVNGVDRACEDCPSGLADQRTNTCLPPCTGRFVPNANRNGCSCPGGTYFTLRPGPEPWCESCGADSTGDGTTCSSCGPGQVPNAARTSCNACGPFEREAPVSGQNRCQVCRSGAIPNAARDQCLACPTGTTPRILNGKAACLPLSNGNPN